MFQVLTSLQDPLHLFPSSASLLRQVWTPELSRFTCFPTWRLSSSIYLSISMSADFTKVALGVACGLLGLCLLLFVAGVAIFLIRYFLFWQLLAKRHRSYKQNKFPKVAYSVVLFCTLTSSCIVRQPAGIGGRGGRWPRSVRHTDSKRTTAEGHHPPPSRHHQMGLVQLDRRSECPLVPLCSVLAPPCGAAPCTQHFQSWDENETGDQIKRKDKVANKATRGLRQPGGAQRSSFQEKNQFSHILSLNIVSLVTKSDFFFWPLSHVASMLPCNYCLVIDILTN